VIDLGPGNVDPEEAGSERRGPRGGESYGQSVARRVSSRLLDLGEAGVGEAGEVDVGLAPEVDIILQLSENLDG
jgi:hypothetical protein